MGKAMDPISVSLFITRVRRSIRGVQFNCVALSRIIGERPRLASFRGLCAPSVGKLGRKSRACLIALLRMPSMVVSCLSLNTPRCVAWYLDFSNCSIASDLRGGGGGRGGLYLRFSRALACFLTSLVI
jgi:hypothetical protein